MAYKGLQSTSLSLGDLGQALGIREISMKSAIVFDFDYTLADSSKGAFECINYALQQMGELEQPYEVCCKTIGLSLPETYRFLTNKDDSERADQFHYFFVKKADEIMAPNTELYDGVVELIHRLKGAGFVLGILSTKFRYRICQILDRYDLTGQFSVIVGGEDVRDHKPHPEGVFSFLSEVSMTQEEVVLVGDSLVDAEVARRSGIDFLAVLTGTTSADDFSDYSPVAIVNSVTEIECHA